MIEKIRYGKLDGKIVYICDLRYNDYSKKPIRNIKPTKVMVRSNEETDRVIYYSDSHFVGLNKNDEPINSKIIHIHDNTGYRSSPGVTLNVFENMTSCKSYYKRQLKTSIKGLKKYRDDLTSDIDNKIDKLETQL